MLQLYEFVQFFYANPANKRTALPRATFIATRRRMMEGGVDIAGLIDPVHARLGNIDNEVAPAQAELVH